ncbi:MAG: nitrogen fixation protein NifQ [Campylobacteraceae bacterium]|jgi:nitrogen fixation protein NifQ|nr:nitrogen fixation protein NifQ [Campylobacteraceae bacterium]
MEQEVLEFLQHYAKNRYSKYVIAPHVAAMSMKQNHLYQDIGFKNRVQMGKYMKCHFPKLSEIKPLDKLWKKFIFDSIGKVAPACATCKDQSTCFTCQVS